MSVTDLSLDQSKLISTINGLKSYFWRVTYEIVDDHFAISIKSHASLLSDRGRLLAKITPDKEKECLLLELAVDSTIGEQELIKNILTNHQRLPVYTV